jgi:cytoplasmic iron level regulating protein YaaA (DUF328/UPF0246 family)
VTTIVIVQCGSAKLTKAAPASALYTGSLFRAIKAAAKRIADRWYIASAKHGLIEPTRILVPYNTTLPARGDSAWGARLRERLLELEPKGWTRLIALCSSRYLIGWAEETGAETPLKGLSIGYAIQAASRLR